MRACQDALPTHPFAPEQRRRKREQHHLLGTAAIDHDAAVLVIQLNRLSRGSNYAVHPTVKRLISLTRRSIETLQLRVVSCRMRSWARLRAFGATVTPIRRAPSMVERQESPSRSLVPHHRHRLP